MSCISASLHRNNIFKTVEQISLDIGVASRVLQGAHEEGELASIVDPEDGTSRRQLHEVVRIAHVRQCPVDRPQPPIFTPEVESVLPPVAMREGQRVSLTSARVERMVDQERPIGFLDTACS